MSKRRRERNASASSRPHWRDTVERTYASHEFEQADNEHKSLTTDITKYSCYNREPLCIGETFYYVNYDHLIKHSGVFRALCDNKQSYDDIISIKCDLASFKFIYLILESHYVNHDDYIKKNADTLELSKIIETMEYLDINPIIINETFLFLLTRPELKHTGQLKAEYVKLAYSKSRN